MRNALEVEKRFGMIKASQHAVEEWRRGSEDHLVSRGHHSNTRIVVTDQLHVRECLIFSKLTEGNFGIVFKAVVGKVEGGVVHVVAGCHVCVV